MAGNTPEQEGLGNCWHWNDAEFICDSGSKSRHNSSRHSRCCCVGPPGLLVSCSLGPGSHDPGRGCASPLGPGQSHVNSRKFERFEGFRRQTDASIQLRDRKRAKSRGKTAIRRAIALPGFRCDPIPATRPPNNSYVGRLS